MQTTIATDRRAPRPASKLLDGTMLVVFVLVCLAAGVVGAVFTADSVAGWYRTIAKPSWTPPDRVFGPVWTVLFILMGVAAWLVWRRGWASCRGALGLFAAQLLLNVGWSLVFFGLRSPGWAFVEILCLWIAVLSTIALFWRHSRIAAVLLLPYLGWSTFAAILNLAIWRANFPPNPNDVSVRKLTSLVQSDTAWQIARMPCESDVTRDLEFIESRACPDARATSRDQVVPAPSQPSKKARAAPDSKPDSKPDIITPAKEYYRALVEVAPKLPAGDERFVAFVQAAFRQARERSATGDPVLENRAALVALGALLGDSRVGGFQRGVVDEAQRTAAARVAGQVTIRGRRDWTQHFCVSAAITATSNEAASNQIGLMKERMDMRPGGSGFSFADLAADRAGTRLAVAATRDETAARAMQDRLAGKFALDDLFPQAADLPEGLSEAALKSRYGGVGGPGYKELMAEIEQRLDRCAALK